MSRVGRCCLWSAVVLGALTALALTLAAVRVYGTPPPDRLPAPAEACLSTAPTQKPGPVHIRKVAQFDIVVYGATGFTGKLVSHYLAFAPGEFTFALAGRSWSKLDALDAKITADIRKAGRGREAAAILVADAQDVDGLRNLARKARVVLALAGPYTHHGSRLVQVCAEEGTHYANIAGEFLWVRRMIENHHKNAQFSGAKIVVAAGYDSVPSDLGTNIALQALDAAVGSGLPVKNTTVTVAYTGMRGGISGGTLASGKVTLEQGAGGKVPSDWLQDPYLLAPTAPCRVDASYGGWGEPRYDAGLDLVGVEHIMAGINARVVRRSLELQGRRGVAYREGMSVGLLMDALAFGIRWQTDPNPKVGDGPSPAVQLAGGYEVKVLARDETSGHTARVEIFGRGDPGYMHTGRLVAEVGLCLLDPACHRAGMGGGILTPVTATEPEMLRARLRAAKHEDGLPLMTLDVARTARDRAGEL